MSDLQKSAVERLAEYELKRRKEQEVIRGVVLGLLILFVCYLVGGK